MKERGRQQSLSAADPQHRWEERPLASALKRQLDSPCCSPLLPGSKPPWQQPHYASFQQLGPCHMRFIISELSYLPVQLMQVSVLSVTAFSQAGAGLPPAGTCLLSRSSGKVPSSGASAQLHAPDTTSLALAPKGWSNLRPAVDTASLGEPKPRMRPELQPLAASGTCLHPLLQAASLTPAGGITEA